MAATVETAAVRGYIGGEFRASGSGRYFASSTRRARRR